MSNEDKKLIPDEGQESKPTPLTLKEFWEKKYEDQLKVAEDQIAADLVAFKNNLKAIRAMNEEEFIEWFKEHGFPQPMFDQVARIFKAIKAEEEKAAKQKDQEVVAAKKEALEKQASMAKEAPAENKVDTENKDK